MSRVTRFAIRGLYEERDIDIPFDDDIKIVVAENGYGKTTVLNALYGVLSGDLSRLRKIDFVSIEIEFDDGDVFELYKSALDFSSKQLKKNGFYNHLSRRLGESGMYNLIESYLNLPESQFRRSAICHSARKKLDIPYRPFLELLNELTGDEGASLDLPKAKEVLGRIRSKVDYKFVYLPTYRRVEQDFRNLGIGSDEDETIYDDSINFGMSDVDSKIKEITKEILESSVEWFSKVNGEMLSQLVEGFKVDDELKNSIDNPDAIRIVLDRIGDNIDEHYKRRIIELIESKDIFSNHDPLVYFIANLSKVYEQQKENDTCIQNFTNVCNRYLGDKKLEYNESKVTVDIVRRKNGRSVDIETLSSGEKQIISLFAKLYLQKEENLAIFFDEPELSLSMEWQKSLLTDIVNSNKCKFLFCTTHSPFIFENKLISHTVDLAHYIREL